MQNIKLLEITCFKFTTQALNSSTILMILIFKNAIQHVQLSYESSTKFPI